MKVTIERTGTGETQPPSTPPPSSDLPEKTSFPRRLPRRRTKAPSSGIRLRREPGTTPWKRGSRPETPLLSWKFDEGGGEYFSAQAEDKSGSEAGLKCPRRITPEISSRKLAAELWRVHTPEFLINVGQRSGVGHSGGPLHCDHVDGMRSSPAKDLMHSPRSMCAPKHELLFNKFLQLDPAMEGATKWDPHGWKAPDESTIQMFVWPKMSQHNRPGPNTVIPALEAELDQAQVRINELESERRSSKKKLEQFMSQLGDERAAWRSREHEKVRVIMDDIKSDLARERKNRQRLEAVNLKLVDDLADARLSIKHLMHKYDKELKARTLIEEVCDELAKEISEDKAEVETLKRECARLREEVEEERRMLQMAEVWREERVQMKLVDAKLMLEEKYAEMNYVVSGLESLLSSKGEIEKADFLIQMAKSVTMHDVRELRYEAPNPDDIFSAFEDGNLNGTDVGRWGLVQSPGSRASKIHTVSPELKLLSRNRTCHAHAEDASEWETVSHPEDQGSSSDPSVNNMISRNGMEWERMMVVVDDSSSISKQWRSCSNNGNGCKVDDCGSPDLHVNRTSKGCIEWPRGAQKSSLKARLCEARMESHKVQLRQVLKHKI